MAQRPKTPKNYYWWLFETHTNMMLARSGVDVDQPAKVQLGPPVGADQPEHGHDTGSRSG